MKDLYKKCTTRAASNEPKKRIKVPSHQYNVGCALERIAIDTASSFLESDNENEYIVVVMN